MPTPNCISGRETLRSNFKIESPSSTGTPLLRVLFLTQTYLVFLIMLIRDFPNQAQFDSRYSIQRLSRSYTPGLMGHDVIPDVDI